MHLTLSRKEIRNDADVLQLSALRNLPELRNLTLDDECDYEEKFCGWMSSDPLTPLALALTPLEHLQILHWEVPVWKGTEGVEALVEMLRRKTLVELKTLMFSTADF